MNVPDWIKLAAASKEELLEEVLKTIDEMGGLEKAQEALQQPEKEANWATYEKYVISKSVTDIGRELGQQALKERGETPVVRPKPTPKPAPAPKKKVTPKPKPKPVEAPVEQIQPAVEELPEEEVAIEQPQEEQVTPPAPPSPENIRELDKKRPSNAERELHDLQVKLRGLLIGMGMAGATFIAFPQSVHYLDLKKELAKAVAGEAKLSNRLNDWLQKKVNKTQPGTPRPSTTGLVPAEWGVNIPDELRDRAWNVYNDKGAVELQQFFKDNNLDETGAPQH